MNASQPSELLPPPSLVEPDFDEPAADLVEPAADFAEPAADLVEPDIVRRFLAWAQSADAEGRAEGVSALARAYLHCELTGPARAEAVLAMTALADDPSLLVRRALAEALCSAREAPRPLILALAADQPEVAAPVLQRSPVLTESDLVDCALSGDVAAQTALARRPDLPQGAIGALLETGGLDAVLALIGNPEADLAAESLAFIFDRFSDDANVREALIERPFLPPGLRARIVARLAKDLAIEASRWMPRERAKRMARDARDQAIASIASSCQGEEQPELAGALRAAGTLTPALLLRSLLGGERDLFVAALAELSGLPLARVTAFIREPRGEGFAALAHRAGLNSGILPAFRAALAAIGTHAGKPGEGLKLPLVQTVIDECERRDNPALSKVLALLWRFAAEATRIEAADFAREAVAAASPGRLPQILDFSPINDDDDAKAPMVVRELGWLATGREPTLEIAPPFADPGEDRAPPVELPPAAPGEDSAPRLESPSLEPSAALVESSELLAPLDDAA